MCVVIHNRAETCTMYVVGLVYALVKVFARILGISGRWRLWAGGDSSHDGAHMYNRMHFFSNGQG